MLCVNLKRPLVTLAAIAGLLAVAGPASASGTDPNGGGDRIHASPSAAIFIMPDNGPDLVTAEVVNDNNHPDRVWAGHAFNATAAVVAADFNYLERATALTGPRASSESSFIDGYRPAIEAGDETKTRPHAHGAALGFFDIPAELTSPR